MGKNKWFKVLMIILDVVAIVLLIMMTKKWFDNREFKHQNGVSEIVYKKFTFKIPNSIKYTKYDDNVFGLDSNNYETVDEILLDRNNFIFDDVLLLQKTLIEDGYIIGEYQEKEILGEKVIIFNNYDDNENTKLCFFKVQTPFVGKVILTNKNTDILFDENLEEIMKILINAKYDNSSTKLYNYTVLLPNE